MRCGNAADSDTRIRGERVTRSKDNIRNEENGVFRNILFRFISALATVFSGVKDRRAGRVGPQQRMGFFSPTINPGVQGRSHKMDFNGTIAERLGERGVSAGRAKWHNSWATSVDTQAVVSAGCFVSSALGLAPN